MESISYITCCNDDYILKNFLGRSLKLDNDDELIVVDNPKSIAEGYNYGMEHAKHRIKCFLHQDLIITNPILLRMYLMAYCTDDIGMVGVVGSTTDASPWWEGELVGSVVDGRRGISYFSEGKQFCEHLDGLLLATFQDVEFDESIPGFHLYDQDICKQMTKQGKRNFCIGDGYRIVSHFTKAPFDLSQIKGYYEALDVYRKKWQC